MRQRLALVAIKQNRCHRLRPAACAMQRCRPARPRRRPGDPSACAAPPPAELFAQRLGQLRAADAHARLRLDLGAQAGMVQFGRFRRPAPSNGVTTRNAALLFTAPGRNATVALSAATPSCTWKSLRHSFVHVLAHAEGSAMRGLVQPDSVSSTARARSASPRSRDRARAISTALFLGLQEWRLPGHAPDPEFEPAANQPANRLVKLRESAAAPGDGRGCAQDSDLGRRWRRFSGRWRLLQLLFVGPIKASSG